ncbi:MAG: hypothetical protein ABTQ25_14415 [Nitrosomonas ureae]
MEKLYTDLLPNFGIGIISGLITALLILIFRYWWLGILRPWYEERVYKDSRIDKTWYAYTDDSKGTEPEELQWNLKQVAHEIHGTIICLGGLDKGKSYEVKGSFHNLILTAVYKSTDSTALDRGTISLMLTNNGQTLKGYCSYYSSSSNAIATCSYECERTRRNINS